MLKIRAAVEKLEAVPPAMDDKQATPFCNSNSDLLSSSDLQQMVVNWLTIKDYTSVINQEVDEAVEELLHTGTDVENISDSEEGGSAEVCEAEEKASAEMREVEERVNENDAVAKGFTAEDRKTLGELLSKLKDDRSESNEVIRGDIGNLQQHMLAHMINRRSHQSSLRSYFDPL